MDGGLVFLWSNRFLNCRLYNTQHGQRERKKIKKKGNGTNGKKKKKKKTCLMIETDKAREKAGRLLLRHRPTSNLGPHLLVYISTSSSSSSSLDLFL